MSDQSQGPGWWQASDGRWYPPEQATGGFAAPTSPVPTVPPTQPFGPPMGPPLGQPMGPPLAPAPIPPPAKSGLGTGPIILIALAAIAIIGAIVFFVTKDDGNKKNAAAIESSSSSSSSSSASSSASRSSSSTGFIPSSSGAPNVDAPAGFKVFSNDKDAFALAVPDHLEVVDLSASDIETVISQLTATNPQFSSFSDQIRAVFNGGGKLFAVDLAGASAGDNLSVIETSGGFDITSSAAKAELQKQIEAIGGKNVDFATQTIHGRKVLTARYSGTITASDGTVKPFVGGQAYVPVGSKIWILTLSSGTDVDTDFDTIIQSFDVNE